jgi:hypothetical protein
MESLASAPHSTSHELSNPAAVHHIVRSRGFVTSFITQHVACREALVRDPSHPQRLCFFVRVADEQDVRRLASASRLLLSAYHTTGMCHHPTCTVQQNDITSEHIPASRACIVLCAAGQLLLGSPDRAVHLASRLMQLTLDALTVHRCALMAMPPSHHSCNDVAVEAVGTSWLCLVVGLQVCLRITASCTAAGTDRQQHRGSAADRASARLIRFA